MSILCYFLVHFLSYSPVVRTRTHIPTDRPNVIISMHVSQLPYYTYTYCQSDFHSMHAWIEWVDVDVAIITYLYVPLNSQFGISIKSAFALSCTAYIDR